MAGTGCTVANRNGVAESVLGIQTDDREFYGAVHLERPRTPAKRLIVSIGDGQAGGPIEVRALDFADGQPSRRADDRTRQPERMR